MGWRKRELRDGTIVRELRDDHGRLLERGRFDPNTRIEEIEQFDGVHRVPTLFLQQRHPAPVLRNPNDPILDSSDLQALARGGPPDEPGPEPIFRREHEFRPDGTTMTETRWGVGGTRVVERHEWPHAGGETHAREEYGPPPSSTPHYVRQERTESGRVVESHEERTTSFGEVRSVWREDVLPSGERTVTVITSELGRVVERFVERTGVDGVQTRTFLEVDGHGDLRETVREQRSGGGDWAPAPRDERPDDRDPAQKERPHDYASGTAEAGRVDERLHADGAERGAATVGGPATAPTAYGDATPGIARESNATVHERHAFQPDVAPADGESGRAPAGADFGAGGERELLVPSGPAGADFGRSDGAAVSNHDGFSAAGADFGGRVGADAYEDSPQQNAVVESPTRVPSDGLAEPARATSRAPAYDVVELDDPD